MKKFKALWFVTALIAVMAVASMASAATTKFLAIDSSNGKVVVVNVDPTADKKITYEGKTVVGAPVFNDLENSIVKLFGYEGGILAISVDKKATNASGKGLVYTFTTDDSDGYKYGKSYEMPALSGDIRDVITFQGNPVIIAEKSLATISNDKFIAFPVSVDAAFVYDSRLYTISGDSTPSLIEFSGLVNHEGKVYTRQLGTDSGVVSKDISITTSATLKGDTSTVVIDKTVYIATGENGSFDKLVIPSAGESFMSSTTLAVKGVETVGNSKAFALTEKDGTLYALEKQSNNDLYLVSIKETGSVVTKTSVLEKLSADIKGPADGTGSFDVYVTDAVIGVVNHGNALAIFTEENNTWKFVESIDFASAAIATTASSSTDDDSKTTTSTLVEITSITDTAVQNAIVTNSGATAASDFLTAATAGEVSGNGTTPSDAAVKNIRDELDDEKATVSAVKDFKPTADGYVLVKAAYNAATTRVFFVELASSSASVAAENDFTEATLLDDKGAKITTGTSTYATAKLSKDKSYTMVTATKSSSSTDTDTDTTTTSSGSSSSGCNAGFAAVSALLALAFFKKSR